MLLWLRVCTARTWCCYDTSTDLTPEWHIYIPPHLPYIDPYTTSFVYYTVTSYLVPWPSARTVTVCRVILYAPGRALFPPFQAPFQSYNPTPGGILTPVLRQCWPSKISARHVHSNPQADLLSMSLSLTSQYTYCFRPEFYKLATGSSPCRLYSLYLNIYGLLISISVSLST